MTTKINFNKYIVFYSVLYYNRKKGDVEFMSNKKKFFIVLGIIVIVAISFILGFFVGKRNVLKTELPLQIEIRGINSELTGIGQKNYTLSQDEIYILLDIITNLNIITGSCDGLPSYIISFNSNDKKDIITLSLEKFNTDYHINFR